MGNKRSKLSRMVHGLAGMAILSSLAACSNGDGNGGGGTSAPPAPPTVTTTSLFTDIGIQAPPDLKLEASGTGPFTWEKVSGDFPTGLDLQSNGQIEGTPTTVGNSTVTVRVTGPLGSDQKSIVIGVLGPVHRASQDAQGNGGTGDSGNGSVGGVLRSLTPGISGNGRFVVFDSVAPNLGATNGLRHVYLKDRQTGAVELISRSTAGVEGNDDSHVAVVSDDGRFVAFDSYASNLVAGDGNGSRDVFLRDRQAGTTIRISRSASSGGDAPCPHGQGEFCNSFDPSMSADGNIIAFGSLATLNPNEDVHPGPPPTTTDDLEADIYVFNRAAGTLQVVTRTSSGRSGSPAVSADGNFIVFASTALDLIGFAGTDDPVDDVFRYNVLTREIHKVSVPSAGGLPGFAGASQNPSISETGSRIAFSSVASNLLAGDPSTVRDIFVVEMQPSGAVSYVVRIGGDQDSDSSSLSRNGTFVAFQSLAMDLPGSPNPGGVQQIYVADIGISISLASRTSGGVPANGESRFPVMSGNGQFITFYSAATDLVVPDANGGAFDAFVVQRP